MLPAIIFIHDVYMSLLEQDHQEGAGVQERYKMYEMLQDVRDIRDVRERYKNAIQLCTRTLEDVREHYEMYKNAATLLRTRMLLRTRTLRERDATRVCGQQR